jgi:enterochelin esterase-like enzyme
MSMGGGQSLIFGLGNLDKFAWIGGFSSAPNTRTPEELIPDPVKAKQQLKLLWISCGDKDGLITFSKRTSDYLKKNGIPHVYYVDHGYHDFNVWKNSLYMMSQMLFKPVNTTVFDKISNVGRPAETNVRSAQYPQILPNGRAIFRIKAPEVQKLQLDLGKKYDMVKNSEGVWEVTTDSLSEGIHCYSLLIDGLAVADPSSETYYGMGRMASGFEVPFKGDSYYELRNVSHGDIRIKRYYSNVTNSWRNFYMYTPPGYDQNKDEKYPVLYILHGGGEDQRGWANQGKTDLIIDNLIADKKAVPMLVVMVDGNLPAKGFGLEALKLFEKELKQCVIPFVEQNYKVKTDAASRALAGLSMGGLQTLHAGVQNTDMFGYLGVFSSGWWANQPSLTDPEYSFMKDNASQINKNLKQFWISQGGKEDIAWKNCQAMMAKFDEMQIKYTYSEYPGGHTWPVWRNNLYNFAQLLFKPIIK